MIPGRALAVKRITDLAERERNHLVRAIITRMENRNPITPNEDWRDGQGFQSPEI